MHINAEQALLLDDVSRSRRPQRPRSPGRPPDQLILVRRHSAGCCCCCCSCCAAGGSLPGGAGLKDSLVLLG